MTMVIETTLKPQPLVDARTFKTPLRLVRVPPRATCDGGRPPFAPHPPLGLSYRVPGGGPVKIIVEDEVIQIGAHPDNVVVLDDPETSGFHCRLFRRVDGRLWVRDLGSMNGTWIDGTRISEAELPIGASLQIGAVVMKLDRDTEGHGTLPGLLSADPVLQPVIELIKRAAPSRVPILLLGESGCGKEVAARAVHELSPRHSGPFVPVNCGAIAPELAEAELFGHERGAFTGAVGQSPGAFGAADGGTLFLDEIGDLTLHLQVKLLRALEASEIKPVGAAKPRKVDVRFVCATHRDLKALVQAGSFREDLYYRLAGLVVELPPLRARTLDVLPLAQYFLNDQGDGMNRVLAQDAREVLLRHRWPGNVRELQHVIRLAVIMSDGPTIRASALRFNAPLPYGVRATPDRPKAFLGCSEPMGTGPGTTVGVDWVNLRGRTLEEIEALAIRSAFARHRGNRRAIMAELGLSKSSLLRKLDALGLRAAGADAAEIDPDES